jgi:UDP-glucose:(heptosyl)LPS alpha-1,3-glucosyltransferase
VQITVISPFVDREHGTERAVAELIERLAGRHDDHIDLYAQTVSDSIHYSSSDAGRSSNSGIIWHPVRAVPGPHLVQFLGWLLLNRLARRRNKAAIDAAPAIIFSPGINAFDADVILVHAVFHRVAELEKLQRKQRTQRTERIRDSGWLRIWHRKLYYALLCALERRIYRRQDLTLAAVSKHTAMQLTHYFGRNDVTVIPNGVDACYFSPAVIAGIRERCRQQLNCLAGEFVLLLVGNDWRNKGLGILLQAVVQCKDLPIRLCVVGQDEQSPFLAEVQRLRLNDRVQFFAPVRDIRIFYAAADCLVAPSLEDSFNLPVLEAMSCGLPVIVSRRAGISDFLSHGRDSLLLQDPESSAQLADAIRTLATKPAQRSSLVANGLHTASTFSWDGHAEDLRRLLVKAAEKKSRLKSIQKSF